MKTAFRARPLLAASLALLTTISSQAKDIALTPAYLAEIGRMNKLSIEAFCTKELRKLKGRKPPFPQPWHDALSVRAKEFGVPEAHLAPIQSGSTVIGMNQCAALAAWGRPARINRTTNALGTREQWVYGGRNYLYFRGDRLDSIQN